MERLGLYAICMVALLTIPWLASTPGSIILATNPAWVQNWAILASVAAGFGYVIYQNRLRREDEFADQKDVRLHCGDLIATAMEEMDDRIAVFQKSVDAEGKMGILPMDDILRLFSNELLTISPKECGSGSLSIHYRQIALYFSGFAEISSEIAASDNRRATARQVDDLQNLRKHVGFSFEELTRLEAQINKAK